MADDVVHRVTVAGTDTCFDVVEGERILGAALRAGVWVPFECGWGSCGTCKMTLVEGQVETLFADAPSISPRDARRSRVLACQSTAKSDLVVKPTWVETSPREGRATERRAAVLTERDEIGPAICRLRFTLDRPVEFHEGQHAVIALGDGLRRCYSMSNRPGSPEVEFIMKRYAGRVGSERSRRSPPARMPSSKFPMAICGFVSPRGPPTCSRVRHWRWSCCPAVSARPRRWRWPTRRTRSSAGHWPPWRTRWLAGAR